MEYGCKNGVFFPMVFPSPVNKRLHADGGEQRSSKLFQRPPLVRLVVSKEENRWNSAYKSESAISHHMTGERTYDPKLRFANLNRA
jgi:hypothetical protein